MHRFFADERGIVQDAAYLNAEDAGHALRVLRLESGDEVELVCAPARYRAKIDSTEGGEVRLRVIEKLRDTEARTRVTLYQGLPKADKMELIVQKSTELGAAAIAPVAMIRSVVKLEGKDAAKKTERWQKIAREAVKQCARVSAPEVRLPRKLSAMREELKCARRADRPGGGRAGRKRCRLPCAVCAKGRRQRRDSHRPGGRHCAGRGRMADPRGKREAGHAGAAHSAHGDGGHRQPDHRDGAARRDGIRSWDIV